MKLKELKDFVNIAVDSELSDDTNIIIHFIGDDCDIELKDRFRLIIEKE